ncbi:hypothetical protein MTR67_018327 [Solanum verrucosum]|uniref:Chromo domain-containing protein n=1 Tax=Solanum verrucosum TaxID=315347 RepID=A0AAF0QJH4_SOLVR|nr:hypothetical protein MTR67_018327 [Solanum verrucosum]
MSVPTTLVWPQLWPVSSTSGSRDVHEDFISNDIFGVVLELLKYSTDSTCSLLIVDNIDSGYYHGCVRKIPPNGCVKELPQELAAVHPVFHISMLKKCIGDPSLILPTESVRINDSLSYGEIPVQVLDRQVCRLRTKDVVSVKVLWRNQFVEEATWEAEEDMKKRYPYIFESRGNVDQGTNFLLSAL